MVPGPSEWFLPRSPRFAVTYCVVQLHALFASGFPGRGHVTFFCGFHIAIIADLRRPEALAVPAPSAAC